MEFPTVASELFDIEEAIPAGSGRVALLEDWKETTSSPLEFLRAVLPFNSD